MSIIDPSHLFDAVLFGFALKLWKKKLFHLNPATCHESLLSLLDFTFGFRLYRGFIVKLWVTNKPFGRMRRRSRFAAAALLRRGPSWRTVQYSPSSVLGLLQ